MKPNFEDIIRNKIESPEVEPRGDLWEALENNLEESDFKSKLIAKLNDAEIDEPSGHVWFTIESSIHKAPPFKFQPYRNWFIAASLLIILGTWLLMRNDMESGNSISPIVEIAKPKKDNSFKGTNPDAPSLKELVADKVNTPNAIINSQEKNESTIQSNEDLQMEDATIATINSVADTSGASILEELQFAHLPDSLLTPVIPNESTPVVSPVEIAQVPLQKTKERPGSETAVNYILTKVLGLPKANVAIEQVAKGDKNVWKVNFDSRLLSFSGNLPSGKNAE